MSTGIFHLQKVKKSRHFKKLLSITLFKETGRRWSSKYFTTIPIFYVNAEPHIGHLYTSVIADAANRFQKLKNPNLKTKFMVGTDEHGLKVSHSASHLNIEIKTFCDQISDKYKQMFKLFNIQYDDFVRTTDERHEKAVTALWKKIFSKNLIYKGNYSGWYCVADELFVGEHYLDPKKTEEDCLRYTLDGKPVKFMKEENYKFKLSNFQNDLLYWLKGEVVKPNLFQLTLVKWIEQEENLVDISVSRPAQRVPWGVSVPGDPSQTIYVWMDALSSYLCSNGYPESSFKWPPDVQIFGKDILKFHGIFWPAFLMAADLEPPRCLYCHSHWLKDGEKMSKSKGNVVDPFESSKKYSAEGLRYFLLRGGVPQNDGSEFKVNQTLKCLNEVLPHFKDFSDKKVVAYLNSELGDSLGNLLMRCTGKSLNPKQTFPPLLEDYRNHLDKTCEELIKNVENLPESVKTHFEEFNFCQGINAIIKTLHLTNAFFQTMEPWNSAVSNENRTALTLHFTMEVLRVCGILLQPVIPVTSDKLLNKLSVPKNKRSLSDIRPYSWEFSDHYETQTLNLMPDRIKLFTKVT